MGKDPGVDKPVVSLLSGCSFSDRQHPMRYHLGGSISGQTTLVYVVLYFRVNSMGNKHLLLTNIHIHIYGMLLLTRCGTNEHWWPLVPIIASSLITPQINP